MDARRVSLSPQGEGLGVRFVHTEEPRRIIESDTQRARTAPARSALAQRTLQLALFVICVALLIATAAEAWARHGIEQQVAATQAQNAALQRDITTTQESITVAKSPATIEREARAWGYIRAGDYPVIVVTGGAPASP